MISTPLLIYYIYISSSILVMLYAWRKDKEQMNVQLDGVAKFMAFMAIATMARLCILSSGPVDSSVYGLKMTNFLTVFLEDAFYVMIPYYICKKINFKHFKLSGKVLKFLVWTAFSVYFASGHIYQGLGIAVIIGLYPYFISRKYAMKTSFATVMACHFLYDCITFLTVKIAKLLMYV